MLTAALLLSACGFQLRGAAPMPFKSMYVEAAPASQFAAQFRRVVRASGDTQMAERPADAQVILQILNELQDKQILSLSGGGRVSEYRLHYRVFFRLTDVKNHEHIAASEIVLKRDYSYSDSQALSSNFDEALLFRDMRDDAVRQLVRRLQATKLQS